MSLEKGCSSGSVEGRGIRERTLGGLPQSGAGRIRARGKSGDRRKRHQKRGDKGAGKWVAVSRGGTALARTGGCRVCGRQAGGTSMASSSGCWYGQGTDRGGGGGAMNQRTGRQGQNCACPQQGGANCECAGTAARRQRAADKGTGCCAGLWHGTLVGEAGAARENLSGGRGESGGQQPARCYKRGQVPAAWVRQGLIEWPRDNKT